MSTPSASISSPSASLIRDHDSVENGKDFAPPVKKFKVDNTDTDSVPKAENGKDFAPPVKKFKVDKDLVGGEEHNTDSVPKSMEFTPEEAFEIWHKVLGEEYSGKDEEVMRLEMFTKSYLTTPSGYGWRCPTMADRTEQEIERFREEHCIYRPIDNHISVEYIKYLKDFNPAAHLPEVENEKDFAPPVMKFKVDKDLVGDEEEHNTDSVPKAENGKDFAPPVKKFKVDKDLVGGEEHNTDSVPKSMEFTPEEAFEIWRKVFGEEYSGKDEEVMRLELFTKSYRATPPGYGWRYLSMADRTEQEIERFREEHCIYRPIDNHISVEDIRCLKDFDPAAHLPEGYLR
ncbi:uncharacterized protein LOC130730319 isoform X2 [Lotus japonicus]|uniref:uncharacterized protein LOC130730319 isoform X2 n=1 Tax=Lotus japonicus TaxID=34305 RepID=UPI002588669B|nr:uncharacterized protein LOC130730319 isoform X2 [Lotus japonicus]